jgi:mannose-6-phosphate isomerase
LFLSECASGKGGEASGECASGKGGSDGEKLKKALILAMKKENAKYIPVLEKALLKCDDFEDELKKTLLLLTINFYPNDPTLFVFLLMKAHELSPFEAIFLDQGIIHAYVLGTGIEIMLNSDNTIRAGLTPKYIDQKELLNIVNFSQWQPQNLATTKTENSISIAEQGKFGVTVGSLSENEIFGELPKSGDRILVCYSGKIEVKPKNSGDFAAVEISKGEALVFADDEKEILIVGKSDSETEQANKFFCSF